MRDALFAVEEAAGAVAAALDLCDRDAIIHYANTNVEDSNTYDELPIVD